MEFGPSLLTLLIAFLLFVGSIGLAVGTNIPLAFLSNSGDKFLQDFITLAPGSDQATILKVTEHAENILAGQPEVQQRQTTISSNGLFGRSQRAFGNGEGDGSILVKLDPKADENAVASTLRAKMKAITPQVAILRCLSRVNLVVLRFLSSCKAQMQIKCVRVAI